MLFCRASPQNLRVILDAFEFYSSLSSQHVKWEKSPIYFGRNISEAKITDFLFALHMKRGGDSDLFGGSPLHLGA